MPWYDRIESIDAGRGEVRVARAVTLQDEFLRDHFEGAPVFPGAMMLQLAYEASLLLLEGRGAVFEAPPPVSFRRVRFRSVVVPPAVLSVGVRAGEDGEFRVEAVARGPSGGKRCMTARLVLGASDRRD